MKIISWNTNGIRAVERKGELEKFLNTFCPDIFLIQETKAHRDQLSQALVDHPEFHQFYISAQKKGYAGTSVWVKKDHTLENLEYHTSFEGNPFPDEGRLSEIQFEKNQKKYSVLGVYFPNGGKSPEAWEGKLVFYAKFLQYINHLRSNGRIVIWGGDINCAHQEIDLARPKDNVNSIGFLPQERAWVSACIAERWVDVWRKTYPQKTDVYSWWHLISRARSRNVGWRIDYFFVDSKHFSSVQKIEYLNAQMGSDHCPVSLEYKI